MGVCVDETWAKGRVPQVDHFRALGDGQLRADGLDRLAFDDDHSVADQAVSLAVKQPRRFDRDRLGRRVRLLGLGGKPEQKRKDADREHRWIDPQNADHCRTSRSGTIQDPG